ncbi:hypothetical protein [Aeromonas hydrophila]|uniref:hypothetical protein n=1 Tax=Aeromonas hydrophila TaxID=644 RepID=UPI002B46E56E|nr:hypothetical protein [Aeromonas hydrophila]
MDIVWIGFFALLFLVVLLSKRSFLGPYKIFARTIACLLSSGAILLMNSDAVGDASSWLGYNLLLIGLLFSCWMLAAEIKWLVMGKLTGSQPKQ